MTKSVIYTKVIVRTIAQAKRRLPSSSKDFRLKISEERDISFVYVSSITRRSTAKKHQSGLQPK